LHGQIITTCGAVLEFQPSILTSACRQSQCFHKFIFLASAVGILPAADFLEQKDLSPQMLIFVKNELLL
jgi:hypothetical protein